jgi:membrane protease YdiL (CAAX protease family)
MLTSFMRVAPFVVVLVVIALCVRQGGITTAELAWQRPRSFLAAAGWWLLFVVIAVAIELFLYYHGALELGTFKHSGFEAVLRIVGMLVLAPFAEELLFRGLILNFLVRKLRNPHLAIATQAAFFVALHAFAYQNTFASNVGIVQSFIDASLFAYARRQTGSIFTPIAMHMSGNIIAVLEMLA